MDPLALGFATEVPAVATGALSIIPVLIAIIGSLITRKPFECLLVGSLVGCIIMYGADFLAQWVNILQGTISDNVWIIAVCGLFGSLICLLTKARGTEGFSLWAEKLCKTQRTTKLVTFILGVVIFVDDYLNMLTVGNSMRPVSDKRGLPREALAFITGATGTPVCMLLPFSTWAAFYIALFQQQAEVQAMNFSSGIDLFLNFIPYNFFSISMVLITFLFAMSIIPPIGPMKKAYQRVQNGGTPWCDKSADINEEDAKLLALSEGAEAAAAEKPTMAESLEKAEEQLAEAAVKNAENPQETGSLIDFVLPMLVLIVITFVQDILVGVVVALAVCLVQYLIRKKMTLDEWTKNLFEGFADMIPTLITLMAAFMVANTSGAMGLTEWVIEVAGGFPLPALFPAIVFIAVGFITFSTGSFWGTSAIVTPILLPLAVAIGAPVMLTIGAILCGCTMGTQVCFFSDGNMLIATSVKNDLMENYFATLPYLGMAIGISLVCLIVGGFVLA